CCSTTGFGSVTLPAGNYLIAAAVTDGGGGSGLTLRFQPSSYGIPIVTTSNSLPIASTTAAATFPASGLVKNDAGTLVLAAPSGYLGATTINAGVLQVGSGTVDDVFITSNVVNNASLVFAEATAQSMPMPISGTGTVTQNGP